MHVRVFALLSDLQTTTPFCTMGLLPASGGLGCSDKEGLRMCLFDWKHFRVVRRASRKCFVLEEAVGCMIYFLSEKSQGIVSDILPTLRQGSWAGRCYLGLFALSGAKGGTWGVQRQRPK